MKKGMDNLFLFIILAVIAIAVIFIVLMVVINPDLQAEQGRNITLSLCKVWGRC